MGVGYHLSSEEHSPNSLVAYAREAETSGFEFAFISDHYHPWNDRQGHSPFVWSVLGAIAVTTRSLRVATGVTCPTIRLHPSIVAQAAATAADLFGGRFMLGVGTGENLNEHVTGKPWPSSAERVEMLGEAIQIIRELWRGGFVSHHGRHYAFDGVRVYTLPTRSPPIIVAASRPRIAALAATLGDGFLNTGDTPSLQRFREAGAGRKPAFCKLNVCYAATADEALEVACTGWRHAVLPRPCSTDLRLPGDFEQAAKVIRPDQLLEVVVVGPDPERHIEAIRSRLEAGYDHVIVHQWGPDQESFFRFYRRNVLPRL